MSAEAEALRDQAIREWGAILREAWKAEAGLKEFWELLQDPSVGTADIIRQKAAMVEERLAALCSLADALDPPPPPPEPSPRMASLMRKKDIAEHLARQFAVHESTCTEGAAEARRLARWSGRPTANLLERLRCCAGHLESVGRYILKGLEEYEKADTVYPDFAIDGIPVEKMGAFVSLLAGTLPRSGPESPAT